jgi:hypothetical protein
MWLLLLAWTSLHHAQRLSEGSDLQSISTIYERASIAWWERRDIYDPPPSHHGFLYLPVSAVAYTPFTVGPVVVRDLSERLVFGLVLVLGLAAFARIGDPRRSGARFLLLTLATIPHTLLNLRQGQMNLVLTGAMLLAMAALATRCWGWAAAALAFGLAMKPLAAVFLLVVGAVYPRTVRGLVVGVAVVFLLPFAFGPPEYAAEQLGDFFRKMQATSAPTSSYYDLRGLLETGLGVVPSPAAMTVMRLLAALGVLGTALLVRRRYDLEHAAPYLYCLCVGYIMLFNPKNEDPTYLLLGPAVGYVAAQLALAERRHVPALLLLAVSALTALSYELLGGRRYWFRPALVIVFLAFVLVRILRPPPPERASASPAPGPDPGPGSAAFRDLTS